MSAKAIVICRRELLALFVSPVAYCVATGFLLLGGFMFFSYLGSFNDALARAAALPIEAREDVNLNYWVVERYYHTLIFVLIFLAPLLTMRTFPEERRRGTFELLLTSPVSVRQIVLGKFLALVVMMALMSLLALVFPLLLCLIGEPEIAPLLCGLLAVLLCGVAFAAVGLAAAAFSDSQVTAGVSGLIVLLLLYLLFSPAKSLGGSAEAVLQYLSPAWQAQDLVQGVLSVRAAVYFVSLTLLGLWVSERVVEMQRGR